MRIKMAIIASVVVVFTSCDTENDFVNLESTLTTENAFVGTTEGDDLYINFKLKNPLSQDLILKASFDTTGILAYVNGGGADYDPALEYSIDGGDSWEKEPDAQQVRFPKGTRKLKVRIRTKNDTVPEVTEKFTFKLSPVGSQFEVSEPDLVTCTIKDDDIENLPLKSNQIGQAALSFWKRDGKFELVGMKDDVLDRVHKEIIDSAKYNLAVKDIEALVVLADVKLRTIEMLYDLNSGVGAYVGPLAPQGSGDQPIREEEKNNWTMGVNLAFAFYDFGNPAAGGENYVPPAKQAYDANGVFGNTLVHELGHLLTLNFATQYEYSSSTELECAKAIQNAGCPKNTEAYMHKFYEEFYNRPDSLPLPSPAFVSDYAETNAVEDIAEDFAAYVVAENEVTPPATEQERKQSSGAKQKVYFIGDQPGLADKRNQIRAMYERDHRPLSSSSYTESGVFEYNVDKNGNRVSCLNRARLLEMLRGED